MKHYINKRCSAKLRKLCIYGCAGVLITLIYFFAINTPISLVDTRYTLYSNASPADAREITDRDILCPITPPNLGKLHKLNETISLKDSEKGLKEAVLSGGSFSPSSCLARWKIAIFVCFRDRNEHLGPFTYHMHNFLQKQLIQYTIYIVNQTDALPFNRAKLFNVAYVETQSDGPFDCYVFHDVDFLPENSRNLYYCSDMPRHMTVYYDNHPYINDKVFEKYFGGVVMLKEEHLKMVNGWSNIYWGWGGEDDDMKVRILKQNLTIWRYPKDIGHYKMLKHKSSPKNPIRYKTLKKAKELMSKDGLNSLKYKLESIVKHPLFTSINVNLTDEAFLNSVK